MRAGEITWELCSERFVEALREYVGPGRKWSNDQAAMAIDTDPRTMRSYTSGEKLPPFPKLFRMFVVFGPGFANRLLRLSQMDGCFRQDVEPITDLQLNGDTSQLIGDLGRALRDGRIDHTERPEILRDARVLQQALQDWIAMADAPPNINDNTGGKRARFDA